MTGKRDLAAKLAARFDIPRALLPGGFALAMAGDSELTVRGCKRILSYEETEILLAVGSTVLRVTGHGLYCSAFSGGVVTLTGKITGLLLGGI